MNEGVKMCFTCLKTDSKVLTDVHKLDSDNISFLDKLKYCIQVELAEDDRMEMCLTCIKHLRITYKFKETVLMSQETLKKCWKQLKADRTNFNVFSFKTENKNDLIKNETPNYTICDDIKEIVIEPGDEDDVKAETSSDDDDDDDSCDYYELGESNVMCRKCKKFCSPEDFLQHTCNGNNESDVKLNQKFRKKNDNRPKTYTIKPKPELNVECGYCGDSFNKNWKLQKHITRLHSDIKKYNCSYCDKSFKQSYHLKEHVTSHTGEKNFSCSICDKKFQRLSSVSRHARSHEAAPGQKTKRTPYLCTICGKRFPFSNGAQRHMRIHLGIRRYECTVCGRKFSQSTHLHVHMRTHTGEKPYICDTCGESFSLNAALQKHISSHQKLVKVEPILYKHELFE